MVPQVHAGFASSGGHGAAQGDRESREQDQSGHEQTIYVQWPARAVGHLCETGNDYASGALFARSTPIPVVQIGDTIKSATTHTVSAVSVHDPIAAANLDNALIARAERAGDRRIAFWAPVALSKKNECRWGER
jgi:hypothetical protein